jgi:hypothetical protein
MSQARTLTATLLLSSSLLFNQTALAVPVYTTVGTATNASTPSSWLNFTFDITNLISNASHALLSFDLRNDGPGSLYAPDPTTSQVSLGIDGSNYFVHFDYLSGFDVSHWRNAQLLIDGLGYTDQFATFNNHLGDEFSGTAYQGAGIAYNILGQSGFDASTYIMTPTTSPVPAPAAIGLLSAGLLSWLGTRKLLSTAKRAHSDTVSNV